ncbi:MAG: HEAT repeat domain-containing protein [Planctomycetota bacterium]
MTQNLRRQPRLLAVFLGLATLMPGSLCAQDDEKPAPAKPDPAVAEKIKELHKAVAEPKFTRDGDAVRIIDELQQAYADMHPKDQSAVIGGLSKVFQIGKKRPLDQPGLYRGAVFALGKIGGPDAAKVILGLLGRDPFKSRDWQSFQEDLYENLGKTKDEKQIEFLIDMATNDPEDGIKAAAGKALRHYDELKLAQRKDIFKRLLVDYEKIEGDSKANLDTGDPVVATRKRTLARIRDPWNGTLGVMSGQAFGTAVEWRKWWNDFKDDAKAWR